MLIGTIGGQCFSPVKLFKPRGKSEKSARETLKMSVAKHEIKKKFHGQFEQNLHDFANEQLKLPMENHEKVPVKHLNCLRQIMNL